MLLDGKSSNEIMAQLDCSREAISYHARTLGMLKNSFTKMTYNWKVVQQSYDDGMTITAIAKHFGMARRSIYEAFARGDLIRKPNLAEASLHDQGDDITLNVEPLEADEPPVKNILQAICDAMNDEDDAYRQCYKFIEWFDDLTDAEKEIADMTLIYICGWSFKTLLEKSEDWNEEDI